LLAPHAFKSGIDEPKLKQVKQRSGFDTKHPFNPISALPLRMGKESGDIVGDYS
jgi:hypothetical protein